MNIKIEYWIANIESLRSTAKVELDIGVSTCEFYRGYNSLKTSFPRLLRFYFKRWLYSIATSAPFNHMVAKMMPTWLYPQHVAMFPLNRRYNTYRRHLGRSDMVVARCWQQWITEVRVYRRGGSGRPRNTNDREDRAIRRVATSAPTTSLASIQRHLPPSRHPVPSRETIRRRLTEVG
ncbi:hypothetical protein TNCV_3736691 [Trichonephila clavipes]|nr:hypothetical protein TNCV_3736691 [Trichonephila clavipes]